MNGLGLGLDKVILLYSFCISLEDLRGWDKGAMPRSNNCCGMY